VLLARAERFRKRGFDLVCSWTFALDGLLCQILFATALAIGVVRQPGAGRNQTTHNHVLFQAPEEIALPGYRRFREYARGFLERCCGDERLCSE